MSLNKISLAIFLLIVLQMFYFQLRKLNIEIPFNCLKIFKSNNLLGLMVFLGLIMGKI